MLIKNLMMMMCVCGGDTNGVSVCQSTLKQGLSVTVEDDETDIVNNSTIIPCTGTSVNSYLNFLTNCTKDLKW